MLVICVVFILMLFINLIIQLDTLKKVNENNEILNLVLPLYEEAVVEYNQRKTALESIGWKYTNLTYGFMENESGIRTENLLFLTPYDEYSIAMEEILDDLNISYTPVCTRDYVKCEERGYLVRNYISLMVRYNVTSVPTFVSHNGTRIRAGTLAKYNRDSEIEDLAKMLNLTILKN